MWATSYSGTVIKTDVKRYDNNDYYMVFFETNDGDTKAFVNKDCWWRFKFNSTGYQASLIEGRQYKLQVVGWRWYMPTSYQNVVDFENL